MISLILVVLIALSLSVSLLYNKVKKIDKKDYQRNFNMVRGVFLSGENDYGKFSLPRRATSFSAGYDFYNNTGKDIIIKPYKTYKYTTDIKFFTENKNEFLLIVPRSSLGIKKGIVIKNTCGIIDADYYGNQKNDGNMCIPLKNTTDKEVVIPKGQAIAQGIILEYKTTIDDRPISLIRKGGIGSTN